MVDEIVEDGAGGVADARGKEDFASVLVESAAFAQFIINRNAWRTFVDFELDNSMKCILKREAYFPASSL